MAVVHRRHSTAGHKHAKHISTLYSTSNSLALGSFHRLGDQASEAAVDAHAQGCPALHHAIPHTLNTALLHHITPHQARQACKVQPVLRMTTGPRLLHSLYLPPAVHHICTPGHLAIVHTGAAACYQSDPNTASRSGEMTQGRHIWKLPNTSGS